MDITVTFRKANADPRVSFSTTAPISFNTPMVTGSVTFNLEVKSALQVHFPSNPIQWVQEVGSTLVPIDPPPEATVSRSDDSVTVTITAPPNTTFRFFVIVLSTDGQFFGTDPTIVTMDPSGR